MEGCGRDVYRAVGLMSGTSLDGIDVALIETDGEAVVRPGPAHSHPYPDDLRARLRACLGGRGDVRGVEHELTRHHADAVRDLLADGDPMAAAVDVVGFHGQTILHDPGRRRTWQIGDGQLLADLTGLDVVDDFRSADVAAGGQGAPFACAFHRAITGDCEKPLAVLNVGGVGNVTWIGADGALVAFDTGPGNALIDDLVLRRTGRRFDAEGAVAAAGTPDLDRVAAWLDHPYFAAPAPKSLDRDAWAVGDLDDLSLEDAAATLTAFTAAAVGRGAGLLPAAPRRWLVSGGGRHNRTLLGALERTLDGPVAPIETIGWNGDHIEAQAFAYLAVRSLRGLPLSFPGTTGVPAPMPGGRLHRPGGEPARAAGA